MREIAGINRCKHYGTPLVETQAAAKTADNSNGWYGDFGSATIWYDFKINLYFVRAIRAF